MTEAVVMDGGRRGEVVKVCADLSCRVHHPDTPSPEQVAKERADERRRIEKSKQAITIRHYALAKVLERVAAPLKKADLLAVAQYTIGHLSYNQVPVLAKRHKVENSKTTKPPQEMLMKKISTYDEATLSRLLLEISLLDSAYQRGDVSQDLLMDAAKRFRVDVEKVEKSVAAEFAAKRSKAPKAKTKPKPKSVA
jgi:ParB family chromosome partitioning protein